MKNVVSPMAEENIFANRLSIPKELKEELTAKGLEWRFINYKELVAEQGYHKWGWTPYKPEKTDKINKEEFFLGKDPDGYFRRKELVLAVRSTAAGNKHRELLEVKRHRLNKAVNKQYGEELNQFAKDAGLKTKIVQDE